MKSRMFEKPEYAIDLIAGRAHGACATGYFCLVFALLAAFALAGCSGLPDKPTRALMYDFGPGPLATQPAMRQAPLPPLAIDDVSTSGGVLDNMAVLYRLAYVDAQQLRPYSQARWSMPPAQLVRQRLREQLSQRRVVFEAGERASLNRNQNPVLPLLLRLELQEFSQLFTAPDTSVGLIRMRATLMEVTPGGERLVGQRNVVVQRPATSGDATGGVRALTQATDAAIEEIDQWLQQLPAR
ncbi:ABC-type transport auxiliary lipoprotein family protein [Polaromonas sp.]|uniref:ABC-type transport auxiliary lipoprotein family protein n=1 Tax=Polaromonas sp. TaxID=1869339 RepID=UPI00334A1834